MVFTHQELDWSADSVRDVKGLPFPSRLSDPGVATLVELLALRGKAEAAATVKNQLRAPWREERLAAEIARAAAWSDKNHRPVIINEFGTLSWQAPPLDRARWLRAVRSAAERTASAGHIGIMPMASASFIESASAKCRTKPSSMRFWGAASTSFCCMARSSIAPCRWSRP